MTGRNIQLSSAKSQNWHQGSGRVHGPPRATVAVSALNLSLQSTRASEAENTAVAVDGGTAGLAAALAATWVDRA